VMKGTTISVYYFFYILIDDDGNGWCDGDRVVTRAMMLYLLMKRR
jgi:hypothetical protein